MLANSHIPKSPAQIEERLRELAAAPLAYTPEQLRDELYDLADDLKARRMNPAPRVNCQDGVTRALSEE